MYVYIYYTSFLGYILANTASWMRLLHECTHMHLHIKTSFLGTRHTQPGCMHTHASTHKHHSWEHTHTHTARIFSWVRMFARTYTHTYTHIHTYIYVHTLFLGRPYTPRIVLQARLCWMPGHWWIVSRLFNHLSKRWQWKPRAGRSCGGPSLALARQVCAYVWTWCVYLYGDSRVYMHTSMEISIEAKNWAFVWRTFSSLGSAGVCICMNMVCVVVWRFSCVHTHVHGSKYRSQEQGVCVDDLF
jgi:hypothetical protein